MSPLPKALWAQADLVPEQLSVMAQEMQFVWWTW